jgi:hypothetical protein
MPDMGVEISTLGFRPQQLLKGLSGNIEVMVNGPIVEPQFQKD